MKLHRGHSDDDQPAANDGAEYDSVELTRVAFIAEAIAIKQDLERTGIPAAVLTADAGGWAPHFAVEQGHRVMVRAKDLAQAQQLLSENGGQLELEPLSSPPGHTKRLRRHGDA